MEHIPIPHSPEFARPIIPVLIPQQDDSLDFDGFPIRYGFDPDRLLRGDFSEHSPPRTAAFLQTWLYFGTLRAVLGHEFGAAQSFIRAEGGFENGIVTTIALEDLVCKRANHLRALFYDQDPKTSSSSVQVAWETYFGMAGCLRKLLAFCMLATVPVDTRDFPARWPLSSELDLSLRVLGHYLSAFIYATLFEIVPSETIWFRFPVAYYSLAQMIAASWCPSEITMLADSYSPCMLHYASEISRTNSRLDHSSCSTRLCGARQVRGDYITKHSTEGCNCLHIGPDFDRVLSIIRKKQIPLITIASGKQGQPLTLEVEAYTGKQNYVAFSHVWSDGLGNPDQNTLPRCQLIRLRNLLNNLSSLSSTWHLINTVDMRKLYRRATNRTVSFWLDTLCIPSPGIYQEERFIGLQLMKETYEKSYQVLILDNELEASNQYSSMESLMRVSIAGWMRRLWTLQEGVLGQRLFAKFKDGLFDLDERGHRTSIQSRSDDPRSVIRSTVAPSIEVASILMKMRFLRASVVDKRERKLWGTREVIKYKNPGDEERAKRSTNTTAIIEAFKASIYRSSSREDDEFTCMASLLGWDISGLRALPMNDRMHYLLSQQKHLPVALLFIAGTRMKKEGWSWAIDRFGSRAAIQIDPNMIAGHDGVIARDGFLVALPALVLPEACGACLADDFVIGFVRDQQKGITGYMRITRHREFEDQPQTSSSIGNDRELAPAISSPLSYVVLYHSYNDPLVKNVVKPAAITSVTANLDPVQSDDGMKKVKFEHLARLEHLGTDWRDVEVLLQRRKSQISWIHQSARLLHQSWCVQ
jgi:hypothetical protein